LQQQAAIWAADLLLIPVKDPVVFPAITKQMQELLASGGEKGQLWFLPSQLGPASPVTQQIGLEAFLRFAAEERGLQVLPQRYQTDAAAQELACRLTKPVLTRVRECELHQQLWGIAELILKERCRQVSFPTRLKRWLADGLTSGRAARVQFHCPLCGKSIVLGEAHYLEGYPRRQRLVLLPGCVSQLLAGSEAVAFQSPRGILLIQSVTPNVGPPGHLTLSQFDEDLELLSQEEQVQQCGDGWQELIYAATGRRLEELYAEKVLLTGLQLVVDIFDRQWYGQFAKKTTGIASALLSRKNLTADLFY